MSKKWVGIGVVAAVAGIVSARAYFWMPETHIGVCDTSALSDPYQKTVEFLDSIIQLGLTLATAMIGLGAGLLLGLQGTLRPTPWISAILAGSMISLAQAVLYGLWWKAGIANLWFNECWEKIDAPFLQYRYGWSFNFFMIGIVLLAVLVALVAIQRVREAE
ncbi:hypothetical protein [Mesorhizobium sp. LNHC209A00]|uniref:hypothetical protein n=1 Tax=Mesorhizobium TaxID=68287 RepID=UPI0003D00370|nr:hypothetical protein [Mesorhizobium sp. LNHC209A00]ESY94861.1 hypothetical protein X738_23215 [Mesorhizobium sp. LNHC209A00]